MEIKEIKGLKTLKDFGQYVQEEGRGYKLYPENELRQEARIWIKVLQKPQGVIEEFDFSGTNAEAHQKGVTEGLNSADTLVLIPWIKQFFNLED